MAKKKISENPLNTNATPARRRGTQRTSPPPAPDIDLTGVTGTETTTTAADRSFTSGDRMSTDTAHPSHDRIAEAAYLRYLNRGGDHGRDFDDWVEAERELNHQ